MERDFPKQGTFPQLKVLEASCWRHRKESTQTHSKSDIVLSPFLFLQATAFHTIRIIQFLRFVAMYLAFQCCTRLRDSFPRKLERRRGCNFREYICIIYFRGFPQTTKYSLLITNGKVPSQRKSPKFRCRDSRELLIR